MMTLSQMATFACNQAGLFDSFHLGLMNTFLDKEYRMVFDSYPWRDTQVSSTATITAVSDTNQIPYPAGMDRIITVRVGGNQFLDPIQSTFLIETDPTIFERQGIPLFYEEFSDPVTAAKSINVFPQPAIDTNFFIIGKALCNGLVNDSDTSILRNCDNAIIAYATYDLLQALRQWGKAASKLTEAQSLLALAQSVEKDQANRPRRNKILTVAGNSLAEMRDAVCGICGQWTPDVVILVNEFLRRNYQTLYDLMLWPESTVGVNVPYNSEQVVLPDYIDKVIGVRGAKQYTLAPAEITVFLGLNPAIFEQTGDQVSFTTLTPCAVAVLPPESEALVLASTDPGDTSTVFIRGEINGFEVEEQLVLTGTTPVASANLYDVPLTIAKDITAGDVTVNGATSSLSLEVILANEREKKHQRLWFLPAPVDSTLQSCIVLGKRRIKPLLSDQDTPIITSCQQALISSSAADLFTRMGDARADSQRTRAEAATKVLMGLNTNQAAYQPRLIPQVDSYAYTEDRYCGWLR